MNKRHINIIIATLMLLFLASCNDNHCNITTIINKDGSGSREITLHVDSAQLTTGRLNNKDNIPQIDNAYILSWSTEGDSSRHCMPMSKATYDSLRALQGDTGKSVGNIVAVHAVRNFSTVEEMAEHTCFKMGKIEVRPKATFKKSFRWFRTQVSFTETFPSQKINFLVPMSRYLSKEEIGYWCKGEPNLAEGLNGRETDDLTEAIKDKYSQWIRANYFEAAFRVIVNNYASLNNSPISKEAFMARHNTYRKAFEQESSYINSEEGLMETNRIFQKVFSAEVYTKLLEEKEEQIDSLSNFTKLQDLLQLDISYQLFLPGMKEPAIYRITGDRLLVDNCTIATTTSWPNYWAYIITVLLIIVLLIVARRKRKQRQIKVQS